MALLDDVKRILRVSGHDFDDEIQDLINAAKFELVIAGIDKLKIKDSDPLIKRAVTVYCKAHFGWDNTESERFSDSFNSLKSHLTLSHDYKEVPNESGYDVQN